MDDLLALGRTLQFQPIERAPPQPSSLSSVFSDTTPDDDEVQIAAGEANEQAVQALSDLYNLLDTDEPFE